MKIVIDKNIPFIQGVFEPWAEVVYSSGKEINHSMVHDADALIVRTRTRCDSSLLKGSSVRIIASATIGYDHIDTAFAESAGIKWVNAPGCNSGSVMQYIVTALFFLSSRHSADLRSMTLGVVGIGNVGSKVVRAAQAMGMRVLQNDPPRCRREALKEFVSLEKIIKESDIITLHVPLTTKGYDRTHHLFDSERLGRLKGDSVLINTSRGEVVDNTALRKILSAGRLGGAVLDVWEGEPDADRGLIDLADIATPHIAGYSADGKANGTVAVVRQVAEELGLPLTGWSPESIPLPEEPQIDLSRQHHLQNPLDIVATAVRHTYPIEEDDKLFRSQPDRFEYLRNNYRMRREFGAFSVSVSDGEAADIIRGLGFNVIKKNNLYT